MQSHLPVLKQDGVPESRLKLTRIRYSYLAISAPLSLPEGHLHSASRLSARQTLRQNFDGFGRVIANILTVPSQSSPKAITRDPRVGAIIILS